MLTAATPSTDSASIAVTTLKGTSANGASQATGAMPPEAHPMTAHAGNQLGGANAMDTAPGDAIRRADAS